MKLKKKEGELEENDTFFRTAYLLPLYNECDFEWISCYQLSSNCYLIFSCFAINILHSVIFHSYNKQVACCGSEGPNDYLNLRQPLPIECRDTVTGHAFASGCVDELTWYLEDKSIWAAAMAMSLAMIHVSSLEPWNRLSKII